MNGPISTHTQSLLEVKLRKFGREVLHAYQAGMSVTSGRVSSESLDAYFKAFPIMDTVEFRDISRATAASHSAPASEYQNVTIKDRILLVGWKSLQNIRRLDENIEAHISFGSEYQMSVMKAAARKKDQTVFAGMVGSATQINDAANSAMTTTSIPLPVGNNNTNHYAFDSAATGADIYDALLQIKRDKNKESVGYDETIYVTLTPELEYLLRLNEKFINSDYNDRKIVATGVPGEYTWNDFTFVKTDPALLPSRTTDSLKFSLTKGFGKVNSSGAAVASATEVIMWTRRAVKMGTHSYGFKSIVYREPSYMNSPAIQHDFFIGSTRLLDKGVIILRIK